MLLGSLCSLFPPHETWLMQPTSSRPDGLMRSNVQALGKHGVAAVEQAVGCGRGPSGGKLRLLTHCNTGSLATAAYGTALGVVRALAEAGRLEHAFCTETRPYNQGQFHFTGNFCL